MSDDFDWAGYKAHLLAGGAPFDGRFNATIREAIETYQEIIAELASEHEEMTASIRSLLPDVFDGIHLADCPYVDVLLRIGEALNSAENRGSQR